MSEVTKLRILGWTALVGGTIVYAIGIYCIGEADFLKITTK